MFVHTMLFYLYDSPTRKASSSFHTGEDGLGNLVIYFCAFLLRKLGNPSNCVKKTIFTGRSWDLRINA